MAKLVINNAQGEENLEIDTLHGIVSIATYNIFNNKKVSSYCELNNEQVKEVIETLQTLIK
jgi:hypothetical protein